MSFLGFAESSIQLVPDGTLILHIAIILIMVALLNATLFKPINRILAERERRTGGRSSEAGDIMARVDEKLNTYERTLRDARSEGYRLIEQDRAKAMAERQQALTLVREEITSTIAEEQKTIRLQSAEAHKVLEKESRNLAAELSAQILHRPISAATISNINPST